MLRRYLHRVPFRLIYPGSNNLSRYSVTFDSKPYNPLIVHGLITKPLNGMLLKQLMNDMDEFSSRFSSVPFRRKLESNPVPLTNNERTLFRYLMEPIHGFHRYSISELYSKYNNSLTNPLFTGTSTVRLNSKQVDLFAADRIVIQKITNPDSYLNDLVPENICICRHF